jgi:mannose-6-phosphate isomerase-like protein (cupin superfamily)
LGDSLGSAVKSAVFRLADAQSSVPGPDGKHFATLLQRGTLKFLLSMPVRPNEQAPHVQDELYVVVRGHGVLFHDGKRDRFTQGDAMFVAAGTEHHFEDFTEDLAVWVAFYGPQGGEA